MTSKYGPPGSGEVSGDKNGQLNDVQDLNKCNFYDIPAKGLKLLHLSVCHLHPQLANIMLMVSMTQNKPEIPGFSESLLANNKQDNVVALPGYTLHRRDRENREGGGIVLYTCNTLPVVRRVNIEHPQVEEIRLEVELEGANHLSM